MACLAVAVRKSSLGLWAAFVAGPPASGPWTGSVCGPDAGLSRACVGVLL